MYLHACRISGTPYVVVFGLTVGDDFNLMHTAWGYLKDHGPEVLPKNHIGEGARNEVVHQIVCKS